MTYILFLFSLIFELLFVLFLRLGILKVIWIIILLLHYLEIKLPPTQDLPMPKNSSLHILFQNSWHDHPHQTLTRLYQIRFIESSFSWKVLFCQFIGVTYQIARFLSSGLSHSPQVSHPISKLWTPLLLYLFLFL